VLRSLARIAPPLVAVSSLAASGRTLVLDAVYRDGVGIDRRLSVKTFCGKDQKYVKERKLIEKDTK